MMTVTARRLRPYLAREMAGESDVLYGNGSLEGVEDPHPSEILARRSPLDKPFGYLYREMDLKDTDLPGLYGKLFDSILGLPRRIVAGDGTTQAAEAARLSIHALGRITDFASTLRSQLEAIPNGVAFLEVVWDYLTREPFRGALVPVALLPRPMWRFGFQKGRLFVRTADGQKILPPAGKFVVYRRGPAPWGEAQKDLLYWVYFAKAFLWQWWLHFTEKWAAPTAGAQYEPALVGTEEERRKANENLEKQALGLAEAVQNAYAFARPKGVDVGLIEAVRSGSISYAEAVHSCTRAQALLIQGEVNTSGLRPGTGAFASDRVAQDIRKEKRNLQAQDLSAHIKDTLLRWITEVNYGPDVAVPRMVIDTLAGEDRQDLRDGLTDAVRSGADVKIPLSHLKLVWMIPDPLTGEETVSAESLAANPSQGVAA